MKYPKYKIGQTVKVNDCDREFEIYQIGITQGLGVVYYPMGEKGFLEDELSPIECKLSRSELIISGVILLIWVVIFLILFLRGAV